MLFDGAVSGISQSQCNNCCHKSICKFVDMSDELEKKLSELANFEDTPFTVAFDCKHRAVNTYSNTRALAKGFAVDPEEQI